MQIEIFEYMVLYGRGAKSVGEQIKKTKEEAQEIIDKFFKAFPKVQQWINESIESAHTRGFVEDVAGRRRRLPDVQLPKYTIKFIDPSRETFGAFNPFIGCADRIDDTTSKLLNGYKVKLDKVRYAKEYEKIQADALKDGIEVHSNTGFIAQAERQAVNSRVQGGAATLTKSALLELFRDERLRDIKARLINTVHDEILLEAPKYYAETCSKLLAEDMVKSAKALVPVVPMACDGYITWSWYLDEYQVAVEAHMKDMLKENIEPMEAFERLCKMHRESTRDQIYELVKGYLPSMPENVQIISTLD